MLKRLVVTNFAIIENVDITFKDGLTILTGETGAGKSLIIDSLGLLLGDRAQLELIRSGFDKAEIIGYFSSDNIHLKALLASLGVGVIGEEIIVKRTISSNKSTIKINDVTITLNDLKKVAKYLADIHMQFDVQKILNPDNYLEIIDGFKYELTREYLDKYHLSLDEYKKARSNYQELFRKAKEIQEKQDIYEYNLQEINSLDLKEGEDIRLKEAINHLKNYDVIHSLLGEINYLAEGDILDKLYEIKKRTDKLSSYQEEYQKISTNLENYYYEIESLLDDLKGHYRHDNYDPNELEELENRLSILMNIQNKYHKDIPSLIEYAKELEKLLDLNENQNVYLEEAKKEVQKIYLKAYEDGLELSKIRKEIATHIKKELEQNLSNLALQATFEVKFNDAKVEEDYDGSIFKENGVDDVDFLIETNKGEGLKSLSKTISGGEASRIMLAIKALFIKSQKISTVVFDEIDMGISGEIANKVAQKMYEISLSTQVIAITHLPQVASLSKNHLKISKKVIDGRTYTKVKELTLDEKIYEIALMISGEGVTESQLEYAKEMVLR